MKKLSVVLIASFMAILAVAQPPEGPANKGMVFGEKITAAGAVKANDVSTVLADKAVPLKITGKVNQVCTAEGCWLKMQTSSGDIMVRMKDHKFFVPVSMNGKTIVAEGIAEKKVTSVEMLKHYAEDAGKTKAEIDAIKEGKKEIVLQAKGILVL